MDLLKRMSESVETYISRYAIDICSSNTFFYGKDRSLSHILVKRTGFSPEESELYCRREVCSMDRAKLPESFLFGTATASYQVEGAAFEDGRTSSIWDDFAKVPGAVVEAADGRVASDQYHHIEEDIDLMHELGFKAYRFSISWSRVLPHAGNVPNEKGIEYYKKICRLLHERGMTAVATLYHWDLPSELEEKGGWTNRETAFEFQRYAELMYKELDGLVDIWITINEPWCIAYLGYRFGVHAPGRRNIEDAVKAIHHVNLAHGLAVRSHRKMNLKAPVGIVLNPQTPRPATRREKDREAAITKRAVDTEVFLGPLMGKGYPKYCTETLKWNFPIEEGDMDIISQKFDFLGVNYYCEYPVVYDETSLDHARQVPCWERHTDIGWPVDEKGLLRQLLWLDEYTDGLPIMITENGSAEDDVLTPDGRVHDRERIEYIDKHLHACAEAIEKGVNLHGYFAWSFIDNYEWAEGYRKRFGIVYCDYRTLKRYPKDSAYYLRDVMAGYGDF